MFSPIRSRGIGSGWGKGKGEMELMLLVVGVPLLLLLTWIVVGLCRRYRFYWMQLILGGPYIASLIALFNNSHWGRGGWLFGEEITVFILSAVAILIYAPISILVLFGNPLPGGYCEPSVSEPIAKTDSPRR